MQNNKQLDCFTLLTQKAHAISIIKGSGDYPNIKGTVYFFNTEYGVIVAAELSGLPTNRDKCRSPILAFHIHSGSSCTGDSKDQFADALTHYNPSGCDHPYHAGDMPPLFTADGYAFLAFLSTRFTLDEIIGKTVIIHDDIDDFTTQPSGNAGNKIACGTIEITK